MKPSLTTKETNWLEKVLPFFPDAFIGSHNELILERKNNVYFLLDDVKTEHDFNCKMIEWLSRPSFKGVTPYWQKWFRRGLNSYFQKTWNTEDLSKIYTRLGNSCNRPLCMKFILSGFDLNVLDAHR